MADLTDVCLRGLLKEQRTCLGQQALGLVVTEFVSSRAIVQGHPHARSLMRFDERERPVSMQIYGADPQEMADAARVAADAGADILDINMGCPVSKITGHGSGAALLKDPHRARAMVAAVRQATTLPVTVKMRAGWCAGTADPVAFAVGLEEAGAAALAVHPRTRQQGYSGVPATEVIGAIKARVSVPVIGNGDVRTAEDAHRLLRSTGCDGVMVGRGALRNHLIFSEIVEYPVNAAGGGAVADRLRFAADYARALQVEMGAAMALHRPRKLLGLAFRDDPDGLQILRSLSSFKTSDQLVAFAERHAAQLTF